MLSSPKLLGVGCNYIINRRNNLLYFFRGKCPIFCRKWCNMYYELYLNPLSEERLLLEMDENNKKNQNIILKTYENILELHEKNVAMKNNVFNELKERKRKPNKIKKYKNK
jgi:hypothetical protein